VLKRPPHERLDHQDQVFDSAAGDDEAQMRMQIAGGRS
jgi:hypothetical protein